ncbi:undecaprenyl-diphosphatase [Halanaerobium saccharolyticum]|uniref:Undecaprenyl-diphosphatase n=1 Tax=Halanaerobium saccharolyticum TaxID=43595 RepID=A0A4R7YS47_9FIRM|nr:phosphatase PAP2 family protein [Halanaerobium saccharolyticum]RAK05450.1 undecaprenyl-diphosphatase [Halanaerobium saccharolyticum]TDV99785.1 undecaprenyl-diphosphatase [Halanaerobium saccharolyticum]TDX52007.1 undecaprenyl-diphosphatase [Halanaerobium saccharolyticum]
MLKNLDQKLFLKLYNFTQKHSGLAGTAVLITKFAPRFFSTIYFAAVVWLIYTNDVRLKQFIFAPAVVYLLAKTIPYLYNRKRPFADLEIQSLVEQKNDHSFPSTHSSSSFIIALAVLNLNLLAGLILLAAATATALSRIMVGVHYPSDVLGAWLISLIFHFVALNFFP